MIRILAFVLALLFAVFVAYGGDDEDAEVISAPTALPVVAPSATSLPATATPMPPSPTAIPTSQSEPTPVAVPTVVPTVVIERTVEILAPTGVPAETPTPIAEVPDIPIGLPGVTSYIYWLSDVDLDVIAAEHPSVTVIDYAFDGSDETAFTTEEIDQLRAAMSEPAKVIAYMSIGEAEEYHYYWQDDWSPGSPDWIVQENPDWEGNFKVEFWDDDWQANIFGNASSYLDRVISVGFDGVYLDIIDAYEFFEERGISDVRQRMVDFVTDLSAYAKSKNPDSLIVPQNAPELGEDPAYLKVVDGIGMESVYYGYEFKNIATDPAITLELEEALFRFTAAGKFVLTTDYAISSQRIQDAYKRSRANGFLPPVTGVDLDSLPVREPFR
jgi:cysteinyl-tRNA synthetase